MKSERIRYVLILNLVRPARFLNHGWAVLFSLVKAFFIGSLLVMSSIGIGEAAILNQTNFENGEMAHWDTFVTSNGTVGEAGMPAVVPFEMVKEGKESQALQFKAGQIRYDSENEPEQGGGVMVQIKTETGKLELSANVAVTYHSPKDKRNLAGGLFQWIVDDQVIASQDMGPIDNHGILRHHLQASHQANAGVHVIRLRITRPFTSHPGQHAPFQYIDDLLIRLFAHP
jgi:hypothetical protein